MAKHRGFITLTNYLGARGKSRPVALHSVSQVWHAGQHQGQNNFQRHTAASSSRH